MAEEFAALNIPVHLLDYKGIPLKPGPGSSLLREARAFFRSFAQILGTRDIRILHAYLPAANVLGMVAGTICRTPVKIVSKRALCRYKEGHPAYSFFEDLANLAADAVLVNSRAVAEDVRRTERFCSRKIFLVYNGIDVPEIPPGAGSPSPPPDLGLPPDAPLVTYVANLREDKAHLCLVEAAREVVSAVPAAGFLLVGREGNEAAAVRERIRELGLERHVFMTGPRGDVPAILAASRIAAHPGEQEGLSNAILEAMAQGLPVVASRAGGNPETVLDGETGILFPPGNAAELGSAILSLLRDPVRGRTLGEAGRNLVRGRFSMSRMVEQVERTYVELLEGRPLSCLA